MTDFLDRLERQLVTAAAEPITPSKPLARRARRLTPLAATAAVLIVGGAVALAASGVLNGLPVRPIGPLSPSAGSGIPARGGARLLPLRVADPAGGPPWGMRIVHTTRGYICLQVGRVQNGELGELGTDGAFHDDGRFHAIAPDILSPPGRAAGEPQCFFPGQAFTTTLFAVDSNAGPPDGRSVPAAAQREISFGLLGRYALSVTYATAHGEHMTAVDPGSGAFLFVQRPARPGGEYSEGSGGLDGRDGPRPQPTGAVTAITYRYDGRVCVDSRNLHSPHACPQPQPHNEQPAATPGLHQRLHVTLNVRDHLVYGAQLAFTAPYAVTSARESYVIEMPLGAGCHGGGVAFATVDRDVARDSTVHVSLPDVFANSCTRSQTITVAFSRTPSSVQPSTSTVIGSSTIHLPPGTQESLPPGERRPH